jgi:hypothetical protein
VHSQRAGTAATIPTFESSSSEASSKNARSLPKYQSPASHQIVPHDSLKKRNATKPSFASLLLSSALSVKETLVPLFVLASFRMQVGPARLNMASSFGNPSKSQPSEDCSKHLVFGTV